MSRRKQLGLSILAVVVIVGAVKFALTPASWPEPTIQAWLRRHTPYGTPETEVKQFLEGRAFRTTWTPGQDRLNRAVGLEFSDGTHTVQAAIGSYRSPLMLFFVTSTEAFYGFDESGRLVDIRVRKSTDAL